MASTGKRSAQDLTGVDGDIMALEGNGWVVVRTTDGSETLRVQQRYLEKRTKDHGEVMVPALQLCIPCIGNHGQGSHAGCQAGCPEDLPESSCLGTGCPVSHAWTQIALSMLDACLPLACPPSSRRPRERT